MVIARQLYQLQEVDLEIESDEKALNGIVVRLGDNRVILEAQGRLTSAEQQLDELRKRQRAAERETEDLAVKLATEEGKLYGGRIQNPKELANLQHEVELIKEKRSRLDDGVLAVMDEVERAENGLAAAAAALQKLEAAWNKEQQVLTAEAAALRGKLADLTQKRQSLSAGIDTPVVGVYDKLRKQKGQAVVRVEQGICRGCRISLPSSDMQQVRSGNLVHCSSCGRILF
ncbi:MAG: C4-type zinc ribbon domain-containing protein, partial [Dehalococcoidales bacterium]